MEYEYLAYIGILLILPVYLFVSLRRKSRGLAGRSADGSDIASTKHKKYRSIKEIPEIRDNIGKGKLVVYFNHSNCAGCKVLSPEFQLLSTNSSYTEHKFVSINPSKNNVDFMSVGVLFVPTILIYDEEGDLLQNFVGLMQGSATRVIEEVEKVLNTTE